MTSREIRQANLIASYRGLNPTCQQVVQVLAIQALPLNRTDLVARACTKGVTNADGSQLVYKEFREDLTATIASGVIQYAKSQSGPVCTNPLLVDFAVQEAFLDGNLQDYVEDKFKRTPSNSYGAPHLMANMRTAFYLGDAEIWFDGLKSSQYVPNVLDPLRIEIVERITPILQHSILGQITTQLVSGTRECNPDDIARFYEVALATDETPPRLMEALRDLYIAQGNIAALQSLVDKMPASAAVNASILFLQGDYEEALVEMEKSFKAFRKQTKKRTDAIQFLPTLLYTLLLLREKSAKSIKQAKSLAKRLREWHHYHVFASCTEMAIDNIDQPNSKMLYPHTESDSVCFPQLAIGWFWQWFGRDSEPPIKPAAFEQAADHCRRSGMLWYAAELDAITASTSTSGSKAKSPKASKNKSHQKRMQQSQDTHEQLGTHSLSDFIQPLPMWETMLSAVESLAQSTPTASASNDSTQQERIIWELQYSAGRNNWLDLTPFLQKRNNKGWSKGRKVAMSRLYGTNADTNFDFLTQHDKTICGAVRESTDRNYYGYLETEYYWDQTRLAQAIVGHPAIYQGSDRNTPVEVTSESPELAVIESGNNIKLTVTPDPGDDPLVIDERGANRIAIVHFDKRQRKLAGMITAMPPIPKSQRERIGLVAQSLSSIFPVQSDIEGVATSGEDTQSLSNIVVQLTPYQEGLRAELFVQPLGAQGPFCRPGVGSPSVFAKVEGKSLSTRRDLKLEQANMQSLLSKCDQLGSRTIGEEQTEWLFGEAEDALTLVTEFHEHIKDGLTVLWPRGKTHDIAGTAETKHFKLNIKKDRDWFAASGKLKVDNELTLDMMRLLELASASPSRFVQMDDGRYLALTSKLRQRIDEIAAYGTPAKGKVRFAPIRAVVMDEHVEATSGKTDKHWKEHIEQIEEAATLKTEVPSTLQAELRDYQREGYCWMKRLAHWNTGACLADDMGLGKTVQALALLLDRSNSGPSMVVAPASVGFNWEHEAFKFAPTLTTKLFRNWDRDDFFGQLCPGDLAIVSYGLLQSEADRFAEVQWNTILLDEAQAIKNMDTKRSQAVMKLQGDFRLILTGTPLENHLGEMWNLFRFIAPGLLGSHDDFRKRFAIPIERDQCRETRNRLKKLIQPFLLRRTKSEVLSELPSRSESLIEIELSPPEVALYEAVREQALEKLSQSAAQTDGDSKNGQQHLQVLAELTRLRLTCCHPSLVGGEGIESSKLNAFRHKITEIIGGRHKVLVFSQFVKHLSILREELDSMGVPYQYLDGSTPPKRRKDIVNAFQSGQGDVFLISLKAGGTGLNLTAADYVIHMDPWWNPAVEDQATDRAHRIGQTRPVNVYRFITKGTIEEKIVALHETKRNLADSLLSGSNIASKLSTKDLIKLLKES